MTPVRLRLLCALAGLVASCGGPISDFPQNSSGGDEQDPSVGDGDGDGDGEDGDGDDGDGDGDDDGEVIDDGGDGDGDAPDDGDSDADAGVGGDAGEPPGGDAGVPACTHASDGRMDDLCYGVYCQTSASQLTSGAAPGGACSDAAELTLACDGAMSRVVAGCTQQSILADGGVGEAVKSCAQNDASLAAVSGDCLDCYVAESLCSLEHCLEPCLAADGEACETCRVSNCADAFYACSGLPAP